MKLMLKARTNNILVQQLKDETLVYDLLNNKALLLNETAALIWKMCDGIRTVNEISGEMSEQLKTSISNDFIWLALDQLNKDGLLENEKNNIKHLESFSRREVIRKVGFASVVALPIVSSLIAPNVTMAQSLLPNNSACVPSTPSQCASGNCLTTPVIGTNCCANGVTSGQTPTNNAGCVASQPACAPFAATNCCSGTATVATTMGGPLCPPAGFACVCD